MWQIRVECRRRRECRRPRPMQHDTFQCPGSHLIKALGQLKEEELPQFEQRQMTESYGLFQFDLLSLSQKSRRQNASIYAIQMLYLFGPETGRTPLTVSESGANPSSVI